MTDRFDFQKDDGHTEHWCDLVLKRASDEEIRRAALATIADFLDKKPTATLIALLPVIDEFEPPQNTPPPSTHSVEYQAALETNKEAKRRNVQRTKRARWIDFGICLIVAASAMMAAQAYLPSMYAWSLGGCVSGVVYYALRKSREGEFH